MHVHGDRPGRYRYHPARAFRILSSQCVIYSGGANVLLTQERHMHDLNGCLLGTRNIYYCVRLKHVNKTVLVHVRVGLGGTYYLPYGTIARRHAYVTYSGTSWTVHVHGLPTPSRSSAGLIMHQRAREHLHFLLLVPGSFIAAVPPADDSRCICIATPWHVHSDLRTQFIAWSR